MSYNKLLKEGNLDEIVKLLSEREPITYSVEGNNGELTGATDKMLIECYQFGGGLLWSSLWNEVKPTGGVFVKGDYVLDFYEVDTHPVFPKEHIKILVLFKNGYFHTQQIIVEERENEKV